MITPHPDSLAAEMGRLLRLERERADLTQEQLGLRTGADQSLVSRVERGETHARLSTVERLFTALGLRIVLSAEPTWLRVDAEIDRLAALSPSERAEKSQIGLVLYELGGLPCVVEGAAAGLLHGAPVPASAVDIAVRRADLPEFSAWLYGRMARRWDERWQDFGYQDASPETPGPMRWSVLAGEVRARLVDDLPAAVPVPALGSQFQVRPLLDVTVTDQGAARILERARSRMAPGVG